MATDGMASSAVRTGAGERHVVIFQLGRELYGLEIHEVREIIPWQPVTPVPGAAEHVEGIINLRGRVIPVLDVRPRFGVPKEPPGRSTRIVVVEVRQEVAGIVVDAVTEVLRIPADLIDTMQSEGSPYLDGVARLEDRLVILLHLERLLAALGT